MPAKVTIGVPVYNGATYLEGALKSLCAQTYPDLCILISDNGSTDSTPEIIKKYAAIDTRISVFRHDETMPVKDHFDWVIHKTESPLFCYAAYDDLWSENYIEDLVTAFSRNPNAVVAIPRTYGFDKEGENRDEKNYVEPPYNLSHLKKIRHNFKNIKSAVFYALYDRAFMIKAMKGSEHFNHTWGIDFALFLHFLLTDKVTGSNDAIFYQRYTGLSDQRYRPVSARDQWIHYRDFIKQILWHVNQSNLKLWEKISLIPTLYNYANAIVKPRRIIKAWVKETLSKKQKPF